MSPSGSSIKIPRINTSDDFYVPNEKNYGEVESICIFCKVSDSCTKGTCSYFLEKKKQILERKKLEKDDKSRKSKIANKAKRT